MNYPPDSIMDQLHAMTQAAELSTESGVLEALIRDRSRPGGWRRVEVTGEAVDELVARGWLVLVGEDEIECTPAGAYWVRRWWEAKGRESRKTRR